LIVFSVLTWFGHVLVVAGGGRRELWVAERSNERLGWVGRKQFSALPQETIATR